MHDSRVSLICSLDGGVAVGGAIESSRAPRPSMATAMLPKAMPVMLMDARVGVAFGSLIAVANAAQYSATLAEMDMMVVRRRGAVCCGIKTLVCVVVWKTLRPGDRRATIEVWSEGPQALIPTEEALAQDCKVP